MDSTNNNTDQKDPEATDITKEEWFKWKTETFGDAYYIWHEGLNLSAVQRLQGEEHEKALVMLHRGLDFGDGDCATALAAMQSQKSVPEIRQTLANSKGEDKVALALAIHALEPDEALAENLIDVLKKGSHWSEKMQAAISLRQFSNEASEQALLDAVEHEVPFLVRLHSFQSLMARWKVRADDKESKEIEGLIARPNSALYRREGMTEEYQKNLAEARERLERLRHEYI